MIQHVHPPTCARADCGNIKDNRPWCPIHGHFDWNDYSKHQMCGR